MTNSEFQLMYRWARNPWLFLRECVKTLDPQGERDFPDYDYLKRFVDVVRRERFLLVPKSRQMMITWTMTGLFLWRAFFRGPGIYLFLSRNERCAEELIGRMRFMYDSLPDCLRPKLSAKSRQELSFGALGSRIFSIPATPDGPRMYSPTGVFWDEMAFTPYDKQIWGALQPALMSGGSFVGVSSSGGAVNFFAEMIRGQDDSNAKALFHVHRIHYSEHPARQGDDWKKQAGAGLSQTQWQREQEISFDAVDDLVYSEFDATRHVLDYPWQANPEWETYRAIDFGYRHPFVLWLQRTPSDEFVVFDEWSGSNATTEEMLAAIRKIDAVHGISESDVAWSACDPAGAAAQDSGISPADYLRRMGVKLRYRSSGVRSGIEQVQSALRDACGRTSLRLSPVCRQLIQDLGHYRWAHNREEPFKDGIHDHSLDALRYFFVNRGFDERDLNPAPRVSSHARMQPRV